MFNGIRGVRLKGLWRAQRGGVTYWYVRRKGRPLIRLPNLPQDHPEFIAAWVAAWADAPAEIAPSALPGSIGALIEATLASERFRGGISETYRRTLRRHFDAIREKGGAAPSRGLGPEAIRANVTKSSNPTDRLKAWRFLCGFGVAAGILSTDPSALVKAPKRARTEGHPPWTDADKAAFRARWPIGTTKRAAMEVLNWTGLRTIDAVSIGPGHVNRRGVLVHTQSKVKRPSYCPWTAPVPAFAAHDAHERDMMHEALQALNVRQMTFLATAGGAPRSEKALGQMIRVAARDAGVGKSAHGLRKTRGISLAEGGATAHQIMSWLGHQTLKEAEEYTREAAREKAVFGIDWNGTETEREKRPAPSEKNGGSTQ